MIKKLFIIENMVLEHYTGDVKSVEDFNVNDLVSFFAEKREELVSDPEVLESLKTVIVIMIKQFGQPDMDENRFCKNFRKLITEPFKKSLKESGYFKRKEHEEDFIRLLYFINVLKNVLMGNTNLNINKYRTFGKELCQ